MRKKLKLNNKKDHSFLIVSILLLVSIYFLTIGYSAFSATGRIESIMATVDPVANVKVTSMSLSATSNGGVSSSQNYNHSNIYGYISLPNADSTVTYKVDVTVFNAAEMKIDSITGLPSNLEYSISGYTIGDTLCNSNNQCNLGASDDMYITIKYKSGSYDSNNTSFAFNMDFSFDRVDHLARIGSQYYESLQDAIDDVPTNNTETTIYLLKNTSENLLVYNGQNIVFNLGNHSLSNNISDPVITNDGRIVVTNGTINCNAETAAINNNPTGVVIMNDGTISATGSKQTIYNDRGRVEIGGTTKLKNTSSNRPAIHNLAGGTMIITGGNIESTRYRGLENHGTLTIGTKDGNPLDTPIIMGKTHGVFSDTGFNYYDGIIKGVTNAFNDETYISDTESTMTLMRRNESISGSTYKVVQLGIPITITFNANGGNSSEASRTINSGSSIGTLPNVTRTDYIFDGWFDAQTGGNEITSSTTFNSDTEIFAHFHQIVVATIGNNEYHSIQSAVNAARNQGHKTITLVNDSVISTVITVPSTCDIEIDFDGHTLSTNVTTIPLFELENGKMEIKNGTILSAVGATQGAVNNRKANGILTINNMTITARGTRQAVYTEYGTTYIKGNSHFTNISNERAAVQNTKSGTTYILGGLIESSNFSAVFSDSGTLTIGDKDGNISASSPTIIGSDYGVKSTATFNYYDGLIKGITDAISGTINDQEGTIISGTDGNYTTAHLE